MAFGVLDFIDADSVDLAERPVFQAPGDDVFDGVKDPFPGSTKRRGGFFPRKPARPTGQEEHVRFGQGTLPVAPRNLLDHNGAAAATIDAPHRYSRNTKNPHRGMNSKRRSPSRS